IAPALTAIMAGQLPLGSLQPAAMRAHALDSKRRWNEAPMPWLDLRDDPHLAAVTGRPVRRYRAGSPRGAPLAWLHGGGWSIGSFETHHALLAHLARETGREVIALHPRQAPEHPWPAPVEDAATFLSALLAACPEGVHLGGDSAGANLALGTLSWLHDRGLPAAVRSLCLVYGCFRAQFDTESHARFGSGAYGLSTDKMRAFWHLYGGAGRAHADFAAHPLPPGLPPVAVHAAALDPLRNDSRWLAARLGARAQLTEWPGMTHGFLHYLPDLDEARAALAGIAGHLDEVDA
ncbi:MAG: hypothetical protein D6801_05275, partial [Alphaproteobacteria bacterium]